ncbi:MAG: hypothetical protein H7841_10935 [Magnetospirillum sp. WYHS-4]
MKYALSLLTVLVAAVSAAAPAAAADNPWRPSGDYYGGREAVPPPPKPKSPPAFGLPSRDSLYPPLSEDEVLSPRVPAASPPQYPPLDTDVPQRGGGVHAPAHVPQAPAMGPAVQVPQAGNPSQAPTVILVQPMPGYGYGHPGFGGPYGGYDPYAPGGGSPWGMPPPGGGWPGGWGGGAPFPGGAGMW